MPRPDPRRARRIAPPLLALAALLTSAADRLVAGEIAPASVAEGRRLLAENRCDGACHRARSDDDDPLSLYRRPDRKVQSRDELRRQVDFCVSRLGSMIFPEEIGSVVDALDHDHYHFD